MDGFAKLSKPFPQINPVRWYFKFRDRSIHSLVFFSTSFLIFTDELVACVNTYSTISLLQPQAT